MPDVVLSPGEQAALSSLLAAEPVPGSPLPERRVLELVDRLIPCDGIGGNVYADDGRMVAEVELPSGFVDRFEPWEVSANAPTFRVGVRQLLHTELAAAMRAEGIADSLHLSLVTSEGNAVDLWLDRTRRPFADRDVAVLTMLAPLLRRLVSERLVPAGTDALTVQERRVLKLVATGLSNAQIAARMTVATSTVRKHLEHSYRKLGVSNRVAAIAALQGCDDPSLDLRGRLERFA